MAQRILDLGEGKLRSESVRQHAKENDNAASRDPDDLYAAAGHADISARVVATTSFPARCIPLDLQGKTKTRQFSRPPSSGQL